MPALSQLDRTYREKGVQFVTLNSGPNDTVTVIMMNCFMLYIDANEKLRLEIDGKSRGCKGKVSENDSELGSSSFRRDHSAHQNYFTGPDVMSANQELEAAAKAMIVAATRGQSVRAVLRKCCPSVYRQIVQDAKHSQMLAMWGRSVNFDENARQIIVHPEIMKAISTLAGVAMHGRIVHAGLEHTYGYLFSLIETPYGFKRERWTSCALEQGFQLEQTLLSEHPKAGTLLANLTWFLGHIAFRGEASQLAKLATLKQAIASELVVYDFSRLNVIRVIEKFAGRTQQSVSVFTDLVHFPQPLDDPNAANTLLVYSARSGTHSQTKLITAFTLRDNAARKIMDSVNATKRVAIELRYNAYIRGCFGNTFYGQRLLQTADQN